MRFACMVLHSNVVASGLARETLCQMRSKGLEREARNHDVPNICMANSGNGQLWWYLGLDISVYVTYACMHSKVSGKSPVNALSVGDLCYNVNIAGACTKIVDSVSLACQRCKMIDVIKQSKRTAWNYEHF